MKYFSPRPLRRRATRRRTVITCEPLEGRFLLANVLTFHDGTFGVNAAETQLTPANVNVSSFGKLFATTVDGQVYAEPLVATGVTIAAGPNTNSGAAGLHDVVFVATERDTLYAIDASGGSAILWKRSFLDVTGTPGQSNVNNTLNATDITTVPSADVGAADISPEIGITGTPVIDATASTLYVAVKTKEIIGGSIHFVQRLHAINTADGTDRTSPYLIGDTTNGNTNNTQIYAYGSGDGAVTDPYNGTGKRVVQFNALRGNQRCALSLVNNAVYVSWASHGDNGPYHGWVAKWDVSNLATSGFQLSGVFCTSPNDGLSGVWQGGGALAFEADGSTFYFETGNGTGGAPTLNASGFPTDANYNEALVKVVADATSSPTNQNPNGWGLKVADYFIPYNVTHLDGADSDFGSGAPLLLPDSAGITGHPHLILASGKVGQIYVLDRDNLGKFDPTNDHALNSVPNGSGNNTPPVQLGGSLSAPAYYNGTISWLSGYGSYAYAYALNTNGTLSVKSQTAINNFGSLPGSVVVSSNGTTNGVVWVMDRNLNRIHAYDAATLATELWNSGQASGGTDNLGTVVKFATPTVVNGRVFVGTSNSLVVYGLKQTPTAVPNAPTLSAAALSSSAAINLSWTDTTASPNTATGYSIEDSTDGTHFTPVTTAPAGATSIAIALQASTTYSFRIRGFNGLGYSPYSNVANATTTSQAALLDFSGGFAGASSKLALNGSAALNGSKLELTDGGVQEAASAFSTTPMDVTSFSTQFTFQTTAGTSTADGFTFTIQDNTLTALGPYGSSLGYGNGDNSLSITNSVAVKFDLWSNLGEGYDSTGLYTGGAAPENVGSIDLTPTGIDLHSGHVFQVSMTYNGATLSVTILDTQTLQTASQSYPINIPSTVGGSAAYVGFTAGTGGLTATQNILTWTYSPSAATSPNAPSGLGASPASASSVNLTWTNNSTNQTGFYLDRATDAGFTQNLITETLPATPNSFTDTDTGLAPGSTFYYRLRAYNSAGPSGNSNVASVTIPLAPPKPTNQQVTNVTTSEIDMSWQDNAGHQADGYHILRSVNRGSFTQVAALPLTSRTPPSTYTWADTNLTPGTYYEYHIIAYNVSGNNDFAGVNATTITSPPNSLVATGGVGVVNLSWTAAPGAQSYKIYRGTASGQEGTTPIATGVTTTTYVDTSVTSGVAYYYTVTALNANVAPLPAESAASNEANATATTGSAPALNFASGFATGTAGVLTFNGGAAVNGSRLRITDNGTLEARSVFTTAAVPVTGFTTAFTFQVSPGANVADGFTFTIQGVAPTAVGSTGGGLGYSNDNGGTAIGKSLAVKFDLWSNAGEGNDSTGVYVNGASPTTPSDSLVPSGVDLHSGDVMNAAITYDGSSNLTLTLTDTVTGKAFTKTYTGYNIPQLVGGSTAYVGFTGGTGGYTAIQDILSWTYTGTPQNPPPALNFASGFATGTAGVLTFNGGAAVNGSRLRITDNGTLEARSIFTTARLPVTGFTTAFTFQVSPGANVADGFTFTIQGVAPTVVGSTGGGLGYSNDNGGTAIGKSLAVKFDLWSNAGEGNDSTGVYVNGASPTTPSDSLVPSGVDLHSGDVMNAAITYDGSSNLTLTLTDTVTGKAFTKTYTGYNIPQLVGSSTAYVGFTGGTGGYTAIQDILSWTYTGTPQNPPPALNFASGFATGTAGVLTFNGGGAVNGSRLRITDNGTLEARSIFTTARLPVTGFTTAFTFQVSPGANVADGFTFTIQGVAPTVVGSTGGGLGYSNDNGGTAIGKSLAVKFDLWSNAGEGNDSTGVYVNGASPTTPSDSLVPSGVDLHSGDVMNAAITYDGSSNLTLTLTDTVTGKAFTKTYTGYNIPQLVGSSTAYVGFTGGTGGYTAIQDILSWTYTSTAKG